MMTAYLTPQEVAALRGVNPETVRRILRSARRRREAFPGALRTGGPRRGAWLIPRVDAERWEPHGMGRPKES